MGANALLRAADGLPWLFPSPQDVQEDQPQPPQNTPLPDGPVAATSTPQPVPAAGSQAEKAVPNKSLLDWLRQQSDYTLDVPGFGTVRVAFGGVCVSLSALSVAFSAVFLFFFFVVALEFRASMECLKTYPLSLHHGLWCSSRLCHVFGRWAWFTVLQQKPLAELRAPAPRSVLQFQPRASSCPVTRRISLMSSETLGIGGETEGGIWDAQGLRVPLHLGSF